MPEVIIGPGCSKVLKLIIQDMIIDTFSQLFSFTDTTKFLCKAAYVLYFVCQKAKEELKVHVSVWCSCCKSDYYYSIVIIIGNSLMWRSINQKEGSVDNQKSGLQVFT